MLSKLKHTAKHTTIYSLGNISTKIIGLILLPLYTTHLSTSEYGILAILETTNQFLISVFNMQISVAMMRWWADAKTNKEKKTIIFNTFFPLLLVVLAFNAILQPFDYLFSDVFFGHQNYTNYFTLLFIWTSLEIFNATAISLIRLKEKSGFFALLSIVKFSFILGLNIYFIAILNYGVTGIILSQVIGSALALFITIPMILNNIRWKVDFKVFKEMFSYSSPLILSAVFNLILTLSDRYIIKLLIDYSQVGIYSLGYKLAGVINVFIVRSFQMSFMPIAFKMYKEKHAPRFFSKVLNYYTLILVIAVLVLSFFSKEILMIFSPNNKDFWAAYTIVPIIAVTFVFNGMKYIFHLGLHFEKKTKYNAFIVIIGAIVNIGLNLALIPLINIYGAAAASTITSLLVTILYYKYSQKFYKINYEIPKIIKILVVAIVLYFASLITNYTNIILGVAIKIGLLASFPFLLYFWNFFERIELLRIKQGYKKWKNPFAWKKNLRKMAHSSKNGNKNEE